MTSPLFLHYTYVFTYSLIKICPYILSVIKYVRTIRSCLITKLVDFIVYMYVSTIPVHHMCSIANQVQACQKYHSCVMNVHWHSCKCQIACNSACAQQFFLSFICDKHAGTRLYQHMCVKFKLSYNIYYMSCIRKSRMI